MLLKRQETWGIIKYDTKNHLFSYKHKGYKEEQPYVGQPLVLNVDLTLNCNMKCFHCVARDMLNFHKSDLVVNSELIKDINESPFMVLVITGGEPFLPEYENSLINLLEGIKNKGLIIDTNGTISPSNRIIKLLFDKDILVRVSLDSIRAQDELSLRHFPGTKKQNFDIFIKKLDTISMLKSKGIKTAIQSVLHKINQVSIQRIPEKLKEWNIDKWYIQRLIPTQNISEESRYYLNFSDYELIINKLRNLCISIGIHCVTKRDRRHNCVFLLVGDGFLYTQSERTSVKLLLGRINKTKDFFQYVSSSEHSVRYYDMSSKNFINSGDNNG